MEKKLISLSSDEIDKAFFPILGGANDGTALQVAINISDCISSRGKSRRMSPRVVLEAPVEIPPNREFRLFPTSFTSVEKMIRTMEKWSKQEEKRYAIFPFFGADRYVR